MYTTLKRICIADGVGGVPGGYEAASFILRNFASIRDYHGGEELKNSLKGLNERLIEYAAGQGDKRAMATTFTGLAVTGGSVWLMHAGNTRLYSYDSGEFKQITVDHTNYQAMVVDGPLKGAEANYGKNVIYCCFGTGNPEYLNALTVEEVKPESAPQYIIFTSDGIHDFVDNMTMKEILEDNLDDKNKILELMKEADNNGSEDDQTIVIARRKLIYTGSVSIYEQQQIQLQK